MKGAWRPPHASRAERWQAQLRGAEDWLLARQEEGGLHALDGADAVWRIIIDRSTTTTTTRHHHHHQGGGCFLYYQRGTEPSTAVEAKEGLVLRAASTLTTAATRIQRRRSYVFAPPARCGGSSSSSSSTTTEPTELTLGRELGRGAFAAVLHASVEGRSFALKRALRARPSWGEAVLRDEHFLRALAGHEGVMPVVHSYRDAAKRRCLLLPMALGDLHRLRPETLVAFSETAQQLGAALAHIHRRGVIHLDLKPQNVLVFAGQRVRVGDFGSARRAGHPLDDEKLYEVTRPFRAPELLFSSVHDVVASVSIDLWSLGALLWDIYPGESGHPLVAARNSVEQAVLVVALVGFGEEAAAAWGLPAGLGALAPLPPFEDAAPPELQGLVEPLLRPLPRQRSLRHLLLLC